MNPDNPNFRTAESWERHYNELMQRCEELELQLEHSQKTLEQKTVHYEEMRRSSREAHEAHDSLAAAFRKVVVALQECCKPEPDGIGGFVADEFTEQEVLDGRKLLEELKTKGLIT